MRLELEFRRPAIQCQHSIDGANGDYPFHEANGDYPQTSTNSFCRIQPED